MELVQWLFQLYRCLVWLLTDTLVNDPSAGSPTDAVLRLLHPLDNKAHNTFLRARRKDGQIEGPCSLPDHPIG
jgi:hypothetical protein